MAWLLDTPLAVRLALLFAVSTVVASLLNAAIYAWAWRRRLVSPWQTAPEGASSRTWIDRIPIIGWIRLRRDSHVVGTRFWVRPLLIEVGFATSICLLYWWEVHELGLITPQFLELQRIAAAPLPAIDPKSIAGPLHWQFVAHALLGALMTIATFIDFDDRIIPDEVTLPGTLLGLLLAMCLPLGLLPNLQVEPAPPTAGVLVVGQGGGPLVVGSGQVYLEPTHAGAPNTWPTLFGAPPRRAAMAIGISCLLLWCFALTDRHWPRSGPFGRKLWLVLARIRRDLTTGPLRYVLVAGTLVICMVAAQGGSAWAGLLSSLIGMVVAGGLVWAVRIIGTAVLRREAMGFGDVTLMMMVGTLTGWQAAPIIFFLAPGAGLLLAIINLLVHRDQAIPYGPFLCLATVGVIVFWGPIWVWAQPLYATWWLVPAVLIVCFGLLGGLLGLLQGLKALLGIGGED